MKIRLSMIGLCLAATALPALAQTVTVAWRDKPPYHYAENGVDKGILLDRAKDVFATAGIDAHFVQEPTKRIWANFSRGMPNYCSIGWYRLPEREALVQFSHSMYIDPPHAVLVAPQAVAAVARHDTLAALLADPALVLGVVDGVSYGAPIDALIAASGNQVHRRTVETTTMMHMTLAGRVSFMFVDQADWRYWRAREPGLARAALREFPEMPPGLQRYIACSKDLSPALMARLNRALDAPPAARRSVTPDSP